MALGNHSHYTPGFSGIFRAELDYIKARRDSSGLDAKLVEQERSRLEQELKKSPSEGEEPDPEDLKWQGSDLVGLALSGGGIRSATTNLGILQVLSQKGILPMVDYLSTVSGGGYIGSCLSALLSLNKESEENPGRQPEQYQFKSSSDALFGTDWSHFPFRAEESKQNYGRLIGQTQVKHLRTHGNFLVARQGVFARETLRAVGNLFTGIIFHFFIVLLALFCLSALYLETVSLLAPGWYEALDGSQRSAKTEETKTTRIETTPLFQSTPGETATIEEKRTVIQEPTIWERIKQGYGHLLISIKGFVADLSTRHWPFTVAALLGILIAVWGFVLLGVEYAAHRLTAGVDEKVKKGQSCEDAFELRALFEVNFISVLGTLLGVIAIRVIWRTGALDSHSMLWLFLPFAVFAGARLATILLHVVPYGFLSLWQRGFRSLMGSYQALMTYGAALAFVLALLPFLIYTLAADMWIAIGELTGAGLSLFASRLLATRLKKTGRKWAVPLGLKKFALGAAVGLFVLFVVLIFCSLIIVLGADPLMVFSVSIALFLLLGYLVNFSKISLHYFYRDRLIETYLRTEVDDGTGRMRLLHDSMEMPLTHLHGVGVRQNGSGEEPIWGSRAPYHLLLTAINLTASKDLTRKDRKSGYFIFSKLYCGSAQTGYRRTDQYRAGETKLARALTISGAAVGSAMGYQTFFAQAFIATLFNLRTGYWLENPARPESRERQESGVFWPRWLLKEMFASTDSSGRLVNLSDGGHTGDNVGIYPLLERRCKIIVACDAEADPELTFASFTEALRHAYIDMGVDVDIDLSLIRPDPKTGRSRSHCAIGRIRYPDRPNQKSWLIYLKNSLTGDEPEPVQNYAVSCPFFPHETTADQFFNDAQFESYRALGVHIAEHAFSGWSPQSKDWSRLQIVHSPFKVSDDPAAFQTLTDNLMELEQMFLEDGDLEGFYEECCLGKPWDQTNATDQVQRKVTHISMVQIHLMEQVYFALSLYRYANAPDNRGWMNLFRRWGRSETFKKEFDRSKDTFSSDFVEFFERYVKGWEPFNGDHWIPHPWDPVSERTHKGNVVPGIFLDSGRR